MFIKYIIFNYSKEIVYYSSFPTPFKPCMTNKIVIPGMKIRTCSKLVGQKHLIVCCVDTIVLSYTLYLWRLFVNLSSYIKVRQRPGHVISPQKKFTRPRRPKNSVGSPRCVTTAKRSCHTYAYHDSLWVAHWHSFHTRQSYAQYATSRPMHLNSFVQVLCTLAYVGIRTM